jgi:hypothetical protein
MNRNSFRRKRMPCLEPLESRRLLSSLSYSLTTNQSSYQVGQPVQMTFTETNTSSNPVSITVGPLNSGFDIVHDGTVVWESNAGVLPQDPLQLVLLPNKSYSLTSTWNGIPNQGPASLLTGGFTVTNEQAPTGASTTFTIQPEAGAPVVSTVTTDKPSYQPGQSIGMTFTQTNDGTQPVKVIVGNTAFEVSQNGQTVWTSPPPQLVPAPTLSWQTLQPGQSVSETATWNGKVLNGSQGTGTFTLANDLSPTASTTFMIVSPSLPPTPSPSTSTISASLSADKLVLRRGHPVHITLALLNTGSEPVSLAATPADVQFSARHGSKLVWRRVDSGKSDASMSLAPGQTIRFAITWHGRPNQRGVRLAGLGLYTLDAEVAGYKASTTIRLT